jgi:multimeric flavodoxin WrbA
MNIVTLFGSPRKNGNTATLLGLVEEALRNKGHEVDRVDVAKHKINGCLECYTCQQKPDEPGCPQKDDALAIFQRMMAADVVIYASPVFCWSWTSQIKPLIDRHFCLVTDLGKGKYKSLVEGKKVALVGTCAGPLEGNGNYLVEQFRELVDYAKARLTGQLFVPLCTTPEAIPEMARLKAAEFVNEIVK